MTTNEIQLWIDGRKVKAKAGFTILQVAQQSGIFIPSLCYHPALKPSGSCRLCAVEIDGYRGLPAACTTPVVDGMRIATSTPKVQDFRKEMLRMILQDHPRECQGCPRTGSCELQTLVGLVGIDFPYTPPTKNRPPALPGGSYFERDYSLCVHCGRCVRVCHEVRGAKAIVFREVAGRQEVSTPFDRPINEAGCQFCGACVDVCPVGALRENHSAYLAEPRGEVTAVCDALADIVMGLYKKEQAFRQVEAICPVCTAGCRLTLDLNADGEIVQSKPHPDGPSNKGQGCVQGRFLLKSHMKMPNRLTKPLVAENGGFAEKDWSDALDFVAAKLKSYAPGEVAVLSDGRATNEELFALQKLARVGLSTNAVGLLGPKGSAEAANAVREELGFAASTNSFDDLAQAEVVLAIGFNPAATHPIAGTRIREAVMNGAKLVVANPCAVSIARYADVHLAFTPDSELSLILGILRIVMDSKNIDAAVAKKFAKDLGELREMLESFDIESVSKATGISHETLAEAACILDGSKKIAVVYGTGLLESPQAVQAIRALITLSHLTGSIGQAGGGVAGFYGAANAQGARDMGLASDFLPGHVSVADKKERKKFSNAWKSDLAAPESEGVFQDLAAGRIKALFLALDRITDECLCQLLPYMDKLDFVVVQDVVAPPEGIKANVVLPATSLLEKEGAVTNSERRVQSIQPAMTAPEGSRTLLWTVSELARRLDVAGCAYDNPDSVLAEISKLASGYGGITAKRLQSGPIHWPCANSKQQGSPVLFADKKTAWKKWKPDLSELPASAEKDADHPFAIVPREKFDPFYKGALLAPETAAALDADADIVMNPADFFSLGLRLGDEVKLSHCLGEESGKATISLLTPPGTIMAPSEMCRKRIGGLDLVIRISFAKVERI